LYLDFDDFFLEFLIRSNAGLPYFYANRAIILGNGRPAAPADFRSTTKAIEPNSDSENPVHSV